MPTARWTKYGERQRPDRGARPLDALDVHRHGRSRPGVRAPVSREQAQEWADVQDAYIAEQEMVLLDGWLGAQPEFRVPVRLYIEAANANIAGMQQQLWFAVDDPDGLRAGADRRLHAEPGGARLAGRAAHPRRPRERGEPASSTPTTSASRRRGSSGCGTSSSTSAAASRSTPAARSSRPTAASAWR